MNWLFWVLIVWLVGCAVASVATIGEVRTRGGAAGSVLEIALMILLIVVGWPA